MLKRVWITLSFASLFALAPAFAQETNEPPKKKRVERQSGILVKTALGRVGTSPVRLVKSITKPRAKYSTLLNSPDLLAVLEIRQDRLEPNPENALAFRNTDEDYATVATRPYGYCGGLTDLTKKMTFLAVFDREDAPMPRLSDEEAVRRLKRVAAGKVERFEGFRNLGEISSDPVLGEAMKRITTRLWANDALKTSGLDIFLKARKPMEIDELARVVDGLEERVARHELPRILFSAFAPRPQGGKRIHSVMIWKVERLADGATRLHAWETNSGSSPQDVERNVIDVDANGEIFYGPWLDAHREYSVAHPETPVDPDSGRVAQLQEVKEDRRATADMAKALAAYCANHPQDCFENAQEN